MKLFILQYFIIQLFTFSQITKLNYNNRKEQSANGKSRIAKRLAICDKRYAISDMLIHSCLILKFVILSSIKYLERTQAQNQKKL